MVIRLPPFLEERVNRAAREQGIEPEQLVQVAVTEYLTGEGKIREEVSEERHQLHELLKDRKPPDDFMEAVHAARRYARQLEEDNAEWIDSTTKPSMRPPTA